MSDGHPPGPPPKPLRFYKKLGLTLCHIPDSGLSWGLHTPKGPGTEAIPLTLCTLAQPALWGPVIRCVGAAVQPTEALSKPRK